MNTDEIIEQDPEATPPEILAARLIDAWVSSYGQIPWAKAVDITATITKMPEAERLRLLNLR